MIKISSLVWDLYNTEHIKKHNATIFEVKQAIENAGANYQGYGRRFVLIGRSGRRILAIILAKQKDASYYVVTARDAGKKERRLLYENENK